MEITEKIILMRNGKFSWEYENLIIIAEKLMKDKSHM